MFTPLSVRSDILLAQIARQQRGRCQLRDKSKKKKEKI